ncbi:MAG: type II toxin-antitoxin system Phd/YefM family antitoxin [Verrucomicrobiales bacterium]|nr:type II toxin-antitoxin system Phd/YefM family antitoxin [Verrucomicrobiales bacterium]
MKTMAITEFKSHALQVPSDVAARKERVVVTKRGRPLVEVVPYTETTPTPGHLAAACVFRRNRTRISENIRTPVSESFRTLSGAERRSGGSVDRGSEMKSSFRPGKRPRSQR